MQATIAHISNGNESKSTQRMSLRTMAVCVCGSFNRANRTERNENHFKCRKRAYNCRYVWSDLNSILYVCCARFFFLGRDAIVLPFLFFLALYPDHALFTLGRSFGIAFGHHRERGHSNNLFQCSLFALSHTLNFFVRRVHTSPMKRTEKKQIENPLPLHSCASHENVFVYLTMHSNYLRILIFHDDGDSHRRP